MILMGDSVNSLVHKVQALNRFPAISTRESESSWSRGMTEARGAVNFPLRERAGILSFDKWGLLIQQNWTQMVRMSLFNIH